MTATTSKGIVKSYPGRSKYLYSSSSYIAAAVFYSRCDRTAVSKKKVTPLESSYGHHLPGGAASARAARGR